MIGVYKLHWPNNEWFYIGSSKDCVKRHKSHIFSLKTLKHCNTKLQAVYNEFGEPDMIIIKECRQSTLIRHEHIIIKAMAKSEFCCNANMRTGKKRSVSVSLTKSEYDAILKLHNAKTLTEVLTKFLLTLKPTKNEQ